MCTDFHHSMNNILLSFFFLQVYPSTHQITSPLEQAPSIHFGLFTTFHGAWDLVNAILILKQVLVHKYYANMLPL